MKSELAPPSPEATPTELAERRFGGAFAVKAIPLLALLLAASVIWQAWQLQRERNALERDLREAGITEPESFARLRSEPTAESARLLTSRLIVHRVIAASDAERPRAAALLPKAEALAKEVLTKQASNWQASMLLGTAIYLEWSLDQDRRLFTEAATWEKPLQHAIDLAPGHPEPKRLLGTAYLEIWYALSPAKKAIGKSILRQVFRSDERAYRALLPSLIAVSSDLDEIFEVIPPEPEAWAELERIYGQRRAFGALAASHERRLEALEARFEARYQEAAERIRLGDFYRSRSLLLKNVVEAPPSLRFAPHVARSLELYPPGLHGLSTVTDLRVWLDWLLDLDRLGIHPLKPALVGRLLDAVGEIDPALGAHAALLAGDPRQAERYSRLNEATQLENWAPYLIALAHQEISRGQYSEARQNLDMVYLGTQRQAPYLLARLVLAEALGDQGGISLAQAELTRLEKTSWSFLEWNTGGKKMRLELLSARAARGLRIDIEVAPEEGTVVDFLLDSRSLGIVVVQKGQILRLEAPVTKGLHLLEIEPLVQGKVIPATVTLLD